MYWTILQEPTFPLVFSNLTLTTARVTVNPLRYRMWLYPLSLSLSLTLSPLCYRLHPPVQRAMWLLWEWTRDKDTSPLYPRNWYGIPTLQTTLPQSTLLVYILSTLYDSLTYDSIVLTVSHQLMWSVSNHTWSWLFLLSEVVGQHSHWYKPASRPCVFVSLCVL